MTGLLRCTRCGTKPVFFWEQSKPSPNLLNTGKWASNKIFGVTGWATPKRHIFHSDGGAHSSKTNKGSFSSDEEEGADSFASELYLFEQYENRRQLKAKATEIHFDTNNTDQICKNLDQLLTGARLAQQNNSSENIFTTKIRAGIVRLRRAGEHELAAFYQSELKKVLLSKLGKKIGQMIIMLLVFAGLIFFAFFYKP